MRNYLINVGLLIAFGCDDGTGTDHAQSNLDSRAHAGGDDAGVDSEEAACPPRTVCVDGDMEEEWPHVCVESPLGLVSSAIYSVCIVDSKGKLATTGFRGDLILTNDGWTHSAYGNGNVKTTLSWDDEAHCKEALDRYAQKPVTSYCPAPP